MFIYNMKLSGTRLYKAIFFIIVFLVIILCGIVAYKIHKSTVKINDSLDTKNVIELTDKNYATILQIVHKNIDEYVGQKFKCSGYVYRVYDLKNDQFVLARNMIISSDMQTVVVGFLCSHEDAINLNNNTWIEIEGTITKGDYHGEMPILKINNLRIIDKPDEEYVYPPDKNYIETSLIL